MESESRITISSMKKIGSDRLRIRGHTLLCLQGFRGEGYSPDFIENMSVIHSRLAASLEAPVEVIQGADSICAACPNLRSDGCHLKGPGSEEEMKKQDQEVMGRLGITEGTLLSWGEILQRISRNIGGDNLIQICGSCRWLPLGYCKKGIEQIKGGADF